MCTPSKLILIWSVLVWVGVNTCKTNIKTSRVKLSKSMGREIDTEESWLRGKEGDGEKENGVRVKENGV